MCVCVVSMCICEYEYMCVCLNVHAHGWVHAHDCVTGICMTAWLPVACVCVIPDHW